MLRIAHVSDTHVLSAGGVQWRNLLFNKRLAGQANLLLRRGRVHRREYLHAVLAAAAAGADHVVVTGDITNLSLESEYDEARTLLDRVALVHLKDFRLAPSGTEYELPGPLEGQMNYPLFAELILQLPGGTPIIAEHLPPDRFAQARRKLLPLFRASLPR